MEILQLHRKAPYPPSSGVDKRVWKTAQKLDAIGNVTVAAPWGGADVPTADTDVATVGADARTIDTDAPTVDTIDVGTPWLDLKPARIYAWNGAFLVSSDARWNPFDRLVTRDVLASISAAGVEPDLVVCECLQLGSAALRLARRHDAPLLVNQHNSEFEIIEQVLEDVGCPAPVVNRLVSNLYEYEQGLIDRADAVVFQSDENVEDFDLSRVGVHRVIPNGTDVAEIRESTERNVPYSALGIDPSRPTCIFVGAFDYAPNRRAAEAIAETIAPACPDVQFLLVGRNPPAFEAPNVFAPGFVDDLGAYLQYADVALCPLTLGSGTKLKMLDYLAAGLPVVTTPTGVQGLDLEPGKHVRVVEGVGEFPGAIRGILASPERRTRLEDNAHRIADRYAWDTLLEEYEGVVAETTDRREIAEH